MILWTADLERRFRRFLLIDRDGVINHDSPEYVKHWDEFRFYPDALKALAWLKTKKTAVIIVSNQSALHRGLMTYEDFFDLHHRMIAEIRKHHGEILAACYCPHRPEEVCSCRKPAPDLILAAASLYSIPLSETYFIGDRETDLLAARNAGCRGALLCREERTDLGIFHDPVYRNLLSAVKDLFPE